MRIPFGMESFGPALWRGTRGSSTGDGGVFFFYLRGGFCGGKGGSRGYFCVYVSLCMVFYLLRHGLYSTSVMQKLIFLQTLWFRGADILIETFHSEEPNHGHTQSEDGEERSGKNVLRQKEKQHV